MDKALEHEDEPLAEADAAACEANADDCEIGVVAREGTATESEVSLREEIFEAFQPETIRMVPSIFDGMPTPQNERSDLSVAHPFTRETLVCLEDDTEYVERFSEELVGGWDHELDSWIPLQATKWSGPKFNVRSRFDGNGHERIRYRFDPSKVTKLFDELVAPYQEDEAMPRVEGAAPTWVPVRPKRERCAFFKRQVMANDDVPNADEFGHFLRFYNCTARKSVGGAYMTLRDEAMYACDYRSPPDPITVEKYIDEFDRKRLAEKRHLELIRPFNLG